MKMNRQLAAVLTAGVCIGAAATQVIHAEQTDKPPGYIIAESRRTPPSPKIPLRCADTNRGRPNPWFPSMADT